jgi:hypothetical protein
MKYLAIVIGIGLLMFAQSAFAAIGFDAAVSTNNVNLTTVSTAVTVTSSQSNLILVAGIWGEVNAATSGVVSVTYAGSNLTKLISTSTASNTWQLWYLLNPTTGAQHATTTYNASQNNFSVCFQSFYGVSQTTPFDSSSTSNAYVHPNTTGTVTSTTSNANDWITSFTADNAPAGSGVVNPAPSTGDTQACDVSTGGQHAGSAYRLIPTAQTTSTGWQNMSSTYAIVAGSLVPAGAAAANSTERFTWTGR